MLNLKERFLKSKSFFYLTLALLMGFWGYAFVAIKFLLKELTPLELTVLRFFFVFISIGLYMIYETFKGRIPPRISRDDIWKIFFLGVVGVVCYHLALNFGEQYTTATIASLIVFTSPVFTAIFAYFLLREKITFTKIAGILISLAGSAAILVANEGAGSELNLKIIIGSLIVFISPLSWSIYTVFGRKIGGSLKGISRLYYSLYTMLFGSLVLMLFLRASTVEAFLKLSPLNMINLLILSIFSSFFGYIIWVQALERLQATEVSAFLYLIPIYTTIFSVIFLGEKLTTSFLVGALAVFFGVYLTEKG